MRTRKMQWLRYTFYLGVLALFLPACQPPQCSTAYLVQGINNANASPATLDAINLAPNCIYELDTIDNTIDGNNGLPSITSPIIINGNAATIRRGLNAQKQALRLFHVSPNGDLTLINLTLFDGLGMNPPDITLPLVNNGGAVYNNGLLKIGASVLDSNRAIVGGGIYNSPSGSMTINSTSLLNNQATILDGPLNRGGGIYNDGDATVLNSTLAGNFAWSAAGGIANEGQLSISNSTISGNSTFAVSGLGSAIHGDGSLFMEYTTITENSGGANYALFVNNIQNTVEISNSIIANNSQFDCFSSVPFTANGGNLDSDGTCTGFTITANPMLNPLLNNGGPTNTHALQSGSPAVDAALGSCLATDQRGQPRPQGPACDLGAYEGSVGPQPTPAGVPTETPTATTVLPTSTSTATPTPATLVCTYTAVENTNCRASDYVESQLIAILLQGEMGKLIGLNPEYTHGKFELSSGDQCWVWLGLMEGPANPLGECGVPAIDPPPPPPTPTATPICRRDMDEATCTASGGTWSARTAPPCTCP